MKLNNLNNHSNIFVSQLVFFIFIIFFCSCSNCPSTNVTQKFKLLENDMNTALAKKVDILSPRNFKEANKYLGNAKGYLEIQKDSQKALLQIALSRDYLDRANQVAILSHAKIEEVIVARQQAIEAGALHLYPAEFQKADNLLRNVTSDLEFNNIENVEKNRVPLKTTYSELEVAAIRYQNLSQARQMIVQAIKDGAKKYAPDTLAIAMKNYKDTYAYISASRNETDQIKIRSQTVNQSAKQLLQITERQNALADVEDQISTKQSALAREKITNDKFEQARLKFTKDEAEVYRQGDMLTIRLKGLEFPSSKALLSDSNFPLLGKVQRVIKNFAKSYVVVEGHADAVGNNTKNNKLSNERAQTVRDYFLSTDVIPANRIEAIGSGENKPIATNETASGRAQNRRVDIHVKLDKDSKL